MPEPEVELVDEVEAVDELDRVVKSEELCRPEINMAENFLSPGSLNRGPLNPFESLFLKPVCGNMRGNAQKSGRADPGMGAALQEVRKWEGWLGL